MKRNNRLVVAALGVALGACDDGTVTGVAQLNLDRPVDVAFGCYGGLRVPGADGAQASDPVVVTAQPVKSCAIRAQSPRDGVNTVPPGQEKLDGSTLPNVNWYGLILQSAPGTVAIAQFDTKPTERFIGNDVAVLDADPLTPGKNGIAVGVEPIAIAVDDSGCFAVTANAGSCDVSTLELNQALAFSGRTTVTRQTVLNASGQPISGKPAAMLAATAEAPIGVACPAQPQGKLYIAYPNCHAIAVVDAATMKAVASIRFDAAGVPTVGDGNLVCPAECGTGGAITAGVRPTTMDLQQDARVNTRRLAIGADNSASITMVELDTALLPVSASRVALSDPDGGLGVIDVALSPQIGMGGALGTLNDAVSMNQAQYVYAVATDGTVRVADVLSVNAECDTQADPRFLYDSRGVAGLSCLPVGAATTPRRRLGARGPGISLLDDAVPVSVAIMAVEPGVVDEASGPNRLVGYFAFIAASTGATFIVNIDDDDRNDAPLRSRPLEAPAPLVIAHQLRDGVAGREQLAEAGSPEAKRICNTDGPAVTSSGATSGGPRATKEPALLISASALAGEKVDIMPSIQQVLCQGTDGDRAVSALGFAADTPLRGATFPDWRALYPEETWTLTWEGNLSADTSRTAVDGPPIRLGRVAPVSANRAVVKDASKPYCAAGVQPFDILQMRGCDPTASASQCSSGFTCRVHPDSPFNIGVCLPTALADDADMLALCRDFMVSLRRYAVRDASAGELSFTPRPRVLRTTPLDGCTSAQQCTELATYQARLANAAHPVDDTSTPPTKTWACEPDPSRAGSAPRCVMSCQTDADCDAGTVCEAGRCMESVTPPEACVQAPQRYELRVGEAFSVIGTRTGFLHNIIADGGGACIADPAAHPLAVGRLPLTAPPCVSDDPTEPQPNPCSLQVSQTESVPQYVPGTCQAASPASALQTRMAAGIRFSNPGMTFTLVDPTYPGDKICRGDRALGLSNVPTTFAGYTVSFVQTAGFTPRALPVVASYPAKVIAGPTQSVWVVDEGDFLSSSVTQPSTRGRVFRVEAQALTIVNTMQ